MRTRHAEAERCEALARATYDIAEQCVDAEMMRAYLKLAGRWLFMAEQALGDAPAPGIGSLG